MLPEPPTVLLPPSLPPPEPTEAPLSEIPQARTTLKSTCNKFRVFRQYYATSFPEHDPDENITPNDLIDSLHSSSTHSYLPYPNLSSFLLGEWYWNCGVKKSQSSFKDLLKIVGHPDFRSEDVATANWQRINALLGGDDMNSGDVLDDWGDESIGGDWIETPIKIRVPFHKRTSHPGQEDFEVGTLHHRKLVSVIREKISKRSGYPHLHLEPYELYWKPSEGPEPIRIYGELYTSKAFIDAHLALQDSPGEPGCQLPRVVVGLMFASDGTQLTTFSNAKLWPVYLAFGNESKDRRSKPSCQAFEHIAYFETVMQSSCTCCLKLKPYI
jgi:hypothetical protein